MLTLANLVVALFGVLIVVSCIWGLTAPGKLFPLAARIIASHYGLLVTIVPRLIFAAAAYVAAPTSLAPVLLYLIAGVSLLGALLIPIISRPRILRWLDQLTRLPLGLLRLWLLLAVLFGGYLVYAVMG